MTNDPYTPDDPNPYAGGAEQGEPEQVPDEENVPEGYVPPTEADEDDEDDDG